MKIFVTGGTGFVGSHLVEALLAQAHEVTCLVRNPSKAVQVFGDQPVNIVRGDLNDADVLAEGCADVEAVYHIAGLTSARNRAEFRAVNENATRTLANVVAKVSPEVRHFVYLSSIAAAGPSRSGAPHTGAEPARPVSDYGWSKLAGESGVRESQLPWTIVRPPTVYGPRDIEVLKVFKLAKVGLAPVFGDGGQQNSFIFGPDLAQALVSCLDERAIGQTYFASHSEIRTQRELATEVFRALRGGPGSGTPFVLPIPDAVARGALWVTGTAASLANKATLLNSDRANDFLAEAWTCSPAALEHDTGWSADHDLVSGLGHTVEWYRQRGWL